MVYGKNVNKQQMSIKHRSEQIFERMSLLAIGIIGNSLTFVFAFILVCFWLLNRVSFTGNLHEMIGDLILGITFLCLFLIQKSVNRFSATLHLKLNELVSSHEQASNAVIDLEGKTESEIMALSEEYKELIDEELALNQNKTGPVF
jgi:low affinity Fe/Cu permease